MCSVKRATNFNTKEEALLISLVQKYKAIIECRKTDAINNEKKNSVWEKIASEFNSSSGVTNRQSKILKNKYENIKKRTKKKSAQEKTSIFYTGGGPPENVTFTPVEEQVKDILGVRIDGLHSEFDGDAVLLVDNTEVLTENDKVFSISDHDHVLPNQNQKSLDNRSTLIETMNLDEPNKNLDFLNEEKEDDAFKLERQKGDWRKATPSLLKQSKSLALQTPNGNHSRRGMAKKMELWFASKTACEETRQRCLIEESELRKYIMRKEHEKKKELLEREFKEKQRRESEEHILKLQMLKQ